MRCGAALCVNASRELKLASGECPAVRLSWRVGAIRVQALMEGAGSPDSAISGALAPTKG